MRDPFWFRVWSTAWRRAPNSRVERWAWRKWIVDDAYLKEHRIDAPTRDTTHDDPYLKNIAR